MYLCRPSDRTTIAEIYPVNERKIVRNYGAVNELTFSIPAVITNEVGEEIRNPILDQLFGDYLVRYEGKYEIDYYIITNPEYDMEIDEKEYVTVPCYQQQYELTYKTVRGFQGTYKLYDKYGTNGVLNQTLLKQTEWTIDYIDPTLDTNTKQRTFDTSEDTLLEFLFNTIDTYGSYVPVFNTVNKTISIYLEQNYGVDDGLSIEHGKYLKSLNETDNFEDVVTKLDIYGEDGLSINALTPTGSTSLEDYSFYRNGYMEDENGNVLSHSKFMSDSLCRALNQYDLLLEEKTNEFSNYLSQKAEKQSAKILKDNELFALTTEMDQLEDEKGVLISTGDSLTSINAQIAAKQIQIDNKIAEITVIQSEINAIDSLIEDLGEIVAVENNLTNAQLVEKQRFTKVKTWTDTNYTDANELLEQGKKNLQLWSQPTVVYKCDIIDILAALNIPYEDKEKLKIGSVITIYYPRFNIDIKAKIISMTHDIDNNDLSITIANNKDIKSDFLKAKDLFNRSASNSTTINMNKSKWSLSEGNSNMIRDIITNKWDANKQAIEGGNEQQWTLDSRGATFRSPSDPMNMVRIVNSVIALSNDGGITWRNALSSRGLVAEEIFGLLVAGEDFIFTNESGDFRFDADGVTIDGAKLTFSNTIPTQINDLFTDMQAELADMSSYISGAFEDGLIEQSEAKSIQTYLNTLATEKSSLDSKYNSVYNNTALTNGVPKTDLQSAKTAYNLSYSNLVDSINTAILDGKTTSAEKTIVNTKFSDYQTKLSTLATKFEAALDVIAQTYSNEAEANAQSYADNLKAVTDGDIAELNATITTLDSYIDGAFSDGVVQKAEATAIAKYLNILATDKSDVDARYAQVYGNTYLTGTPKTNLFSAKNAYDTSHSTLISSINTAIADGKTTSTEKADVDSKFTDYKSKFSTLSTRFEEALNVITQASATTAENNAKGSSVQKGTGYNSVVIDNNGIVATHSDGSTTSLSGSGLLRTKAGVTKPYNYLVETGSSETGSTGHYFNGGTSETTHGDPNDISNKTITLPDDFKGKDFVVSLSYLGADPLAYANLDGDSFWIPDFQGAVVLELVSKDTVNGTFTVKGNSCYYHQWGSSAIYRKYHAIKFSYTVVV